MFMAKKITSFSLDEKTLIQLKKLAELEDRSQSNMIAVLVNAAAIKAKIKLS